MSRALRNRERSRATAQRQTVAKPAPKAKPAAPKKAVASPPKKAPAKKVVKKAEKRED